VISLLEGSNFVALLEKGHVEKGAFCTEALVDYGRKVPVGDVLHIYGRWVPALCDDGVRRQEFHRSKRGPGAFACTHWEP
jgi:hypothetical protein